MSSFKGGPQKTARRAVIHRMQNMFHSMDLRLYCSLYKLTQWCVHTHDITVSQSTVRTNDYSYALEAGS